MGSTFVASPPAFDAVAAFGIGGLAVLMTVIWVAIVAQGALARAVTVGVAAAAVLVVSGLAARLGVLARFDVVPPPMAVMIAGVLVGAFAIGLSRFGAGLAASLTLPTLIGLQTFRLPLELVMHHAGEVGIMPPELSYGGYNLDILTGASALLLFVWLRSAGRVPVAAVWLWNLWGIYCLAAIVVIAVATSPMVRAFGDDPRHVNTWVLFFPYVWLPVALVTIAIAGHVLVTRKLLRVPRSPVSRGDALP